MTEPDAMKYLIAGLGNIGSDYEGTRHNVGFDVVDLIAKDLGGSFKFDNQAFVAEVKHKGRTFILIKPTTYMNLSGKAVRYWLTKHNIPKENLLVVLDDLALPFGKQRLRPSGSDGGHNGLKSIAAVNAAFQRIGGFQVLFAQTDVKKRRGILIGLGKRKAIRDFVARFGSVVVDVDFVADVLPERIIVRTAVWQLQGHIGRNQGDGVGVVWAAEGI